MVVVVVHFLFYLHYAINTFRCPALAAMLFSLLPANTGSGEI